MVWGGGDTAASTASRGAQYDMGIPMILKAPWGHGAGTSGSTLGFVSPAGIQTIDTYYLAIGLEYGLIGFVVYYGMLIASTYYAAKYAVRAPTGELSFFMPAAIALVNFIVIKSVFSQQDNHPLIFMLMGIVTAMVYRAMNGELEQSRPDRALDDAVGDHRGEAVGHPIRVGDLLDADLLGQGRQGRDPQQRAVLRQLVLGQRRRGAGDPQPLVAVQRHGQPLHPPHDLERAVEAGDHQVVLGVIVVIERALGDVERLGDLVDRGAAITACIDQPRRRQQEGLATHLRAFVRGQFGQRRRSFARLGVRLTVPPSAEPPGAAPNRKALAPLRI